MKNRLLKDSITPSSFYYFIVFPMRSDLKKVPFQIWIIGLASMLITASAAMSFSVFGLFLNSIGISKGDIGFIDGFIEGFGYIFKIISGVLSDYLQKRKLIFAIGALCTAVSKPLIAIFMSFPSAVMGRIIDRLGNGLQATPRDALVGDYAPYKLKGTCFGIRQCLGTLGSVFGVLIVHFLLKGFKDDFRAVFIAASISGILAVLIIIFYVRDAQKSPNENILILKAEKSKFCLKDITHLNRPYWYLMIIVGIFMLGRMSESLIILYGKDTFSLGNQDAIRIMLFYNITSALTAYKTGRIADHVSPIFLMICGTLITIGANLIMIVATHYLVFLLGVILWGLQIGLMQNIFCAEITTLVPSNLRGTAFGIFYFITAISVLSANIISGHLMNYGPAAFIYSAIISILSCIIVFLLKNNNLKKI